MRVQQDAAYDDRGDPTEELATLEMRKMKIADLRAAVLTHFVYVAGIHRPGIDVPNPCWGLGSNQVGWNPDDGELPKCDECGKITRVDSVFLEYGSPDMRRCYRCQAVRHLSQCTYRNQLRLPMDA